MLGPTAIKIDELRVNDTVKVVSDMGSFSAIVELIKAGNVMFKIIASGNQEQVSFSELRHCDIYPLGDTIIDVAERNLSFNQVKDPNPDISGEIGDQLNDRFFVLYEEYKVTGIGEGQEIYKEMQKIAYELHLHAALAQVRADKTLLLKLASEKKEINYTEALIPDDVLAKFTDAYEDYQSLGAGPEDVPQAVVLYATMVEITMKYETLGDALDAIVTERKLYLKEANAMEKMLNITPSNTPGNAVAESSPKIPKPNKSAEDFNEDVSEFQTLHVAYRALPPIPTPNGELIYGRLLDIATKHPSLNEALNAIVDERNNAILQNVKRAAEHEVEQAAK